MITRASLLAVSVAISGVSAQLPPVRPLGPIVATTTETWGSVPSIRALSDGRVVISDMTRRRLVMVDSILSHAENVLNPSGAAASTYPARGGQLFALPGDTTLVLDVAGVSFVVLDKTGKVIRVESVPRTSDVGAIASTSFNGQMVDDLGRLIYRVSPKMIGFSQGAGNF